MVGQKDTTLEFQRHLDMHWIPFLRAAVRAMHAYGFVPWRLMALATGDKVPEVLPVGTFRWTTEVSKDNDAMLSYVVHLNPGARPEPNIYITPFVQPNFMVTEQSTMYATVSSPMSSAIESFKNLQAAIKRQVRDKVHWFQQNYCMIIIRRSGARGCLELHRPRHRLARAQGFRA